MARYPTGQPVRLSTTVRDTTGALIDPTDITLTVQKPDGTLLPVYDYNPGAIVRDSIGTFHNDVPASDLATVGHYQNKWLSTGTGAGVSVGSFDVFDPFEIKVLSLGDAKDHLNIAQATTQYDILIQTWLDTIEENIERAIGGPIITRSITERVTATDDVRALPLRKRPAQSVTSVTLLSAGASIDISDIEVDPISNIARRKVGWPFMVGVFSAWPPVFTVVYTAGLGTVVSPSISSAARIILDHLWQVQRGPSTRPGFGGDDVSQLYGMSFAVPNRALELLAPYMVEAWV